MYGRHYWNVPLSAITKELMEGTCAITAAYCWAAALTKFSLFALFLRLFSPLPRIRAMIWAGIVFTAVSYTALFAAWLAYSVPSNGNWTDPVFFASVGEATPAVSVALSAVSILTDFYVLAVPLLAVSGLNLTKGRKVGVSALFATGLLACAFCVAGLPPRISNYRATNVYLKPDPFWTSMPAYGLAVAEINLGIICACIPVSVPLFKGLTAKVTTTGSSWRRYLLNYRGSSGSSESTKAARGADGSLPKVPKGNLKTLFSLINKAGDNSYASKPQQGITVTRATDIELAPYSELRSIDMDYHAYLSPEQKGSQPTRPGETSNSGRR
ncbi:hypothetical protein S40285_07894 [Stachybotrys chlorohalonatus IBT 40285]|uniref:Rhodopsin domain-containing protein n=1 Tax=Stachybotrys chlorohalonatus (strain IBT 40285) TaxID=1283841 RepID=A0A084R224_STAC4|nr:hypothetical protein S40285_07894 [Stachybotrys chlorohalonata IBT 40285]